ncbi:MAG TPA: hypothetical protein VEY07_00335 [Thermoplasmata archaeon]|nr:hypothetical protein [Thermoplasmata archaeon]
MPSGRETCTRCGASLGPNDERCALCGTPRPTGNPPDSSDSVRRFAGGPRGRRWTRRWLVATVVLELAVVVFFAGVFTSWFGLVNAGGSPSGGGPPGSDPNPHAEKVNSVALGIVYSGNTSGYFSIRPAGNACTGCPESPSVDLRFGAPIADIVVYLNLTNTGNAYHEVTSWNVSATNFAGADPFYVRAVLCCYNSYAESAELLGLVPGQTFGLALLIAADSIPANGGAGYSLEFVGVSPS